MQETRLIKGDCIIEMQKLIEEGVKVDMILCDLPYGVTNHKDDIVIPFEELWDCYKNIISENGVILLFAQGLFYVDLVNSNRKMFKYDIVWDKCLSTGFLNANRMPLRRHENIAVFYNKKPVYNPQKTLGIPNHSKGTKHLTKATRNQNYGEYKSIKEGYSELKHPHSIVRFQKPHPCKALHRTEKPTSLLEYLIKTYTNEGMVVLDNCVGSGSTAIACLNTNRKFIGIELDDNYFDIACERIENHKTIKI